MEQTTVPDQNRENPADEIPQQLNNDDNNTQKLKKTQIVQQMIIIRKPQKILKTPHCKQNP